MLLIPSWITLPRPQPAVPVRVRDSATLSSRRIERHRDMVMHHEPVAIDLPKTRRSSNPDIAHLSIPYRAAQPIDAVRERRAIAHGDFEVANLIAERRLEHGECLHSVFLLPLLRSVAARPHVVGHKVGSANRRHTLEIHGANRFGGNLGRPLSA